MYSVFITSLQTLNQLITAGIAITAFSLLLYALTFNLRDRVARSFALILLCVVIVFVADSIGSTTTSPTDLEFWLRVRWLGIPSCCVRCARRSLRTGGPWPTSDCPSSRTSSATGDSASARP
ncbi:MAG: hypothetical protein ACWGO1_13470, partial [Anaerolineales bacterium]